MKRKKLIFLLLFALLAIPVTWAQEAESNVYVKVTSAGQLQAGNKYILVHVYPGTNTYVNVAGGWANTGLSRRYFYYKAVNTNANYNYVSNDNNAIDISVLTTGHSAGYVSEFELGGEAGAWTFKFPNGKYLSGPSTEPTGTGNNSISEQSNTNNNYSKWIITDDFVLKNAAYTSRSIRQQTSSASFKLLDAADQTFFDSYLYVQAGKSSLNAPETLDMEETATFALTGENLLKDVTITSSNPDFTVDQSSIALDNYGVNTNVTVTYTGDAALATATITIKSGNITKEVAVTATKPVPSLIVSSNTLALGTEPSASFAVNGAYLSDDVSVTIKAGSDDGFVVGPTTIGLNNGSVSNVDVMVLYRGTSSNANATITLTSGDLTQEVAVTASAPALFTTAGNYYVQNKGNNKYVVIDGTTDAAASAAEKEDADVITLGFNADGTVSTMKNYDGDGDLIAALETVKEVLTNKLTQNNMNADFVADMFKIKLVKTGSSDGSMYFCFDIPYIEDIDNIRAYLLGQGINNQLVKDYLDLLLQPGKRIYLCTADDNGTFSFTQDKTANASKWLVEEYVKVEDVLFTTPGNYNIKNKGNKQYVVINGSTDAEVSEPEKDFADIITLGFNEDGTVSTMKNYAGEGDVMETLVTVKQVLADKIHQYDSNINTDFLEEMFKMRLVDTGDGDGSIYLCLDIPKIKNIDEIRAAIESTVNNAQVKEYLNQLLQPRRRVYMCVNSEDNKSLSFTRDNGNLSKWLVEEAEVYEDELFTTPGNYYINNKKTGKFVRLENSQLADVTAENQAQADIITLDFNENGAVSVMEQYEGDGNMIAALNMIKSSFKDALEAGGYATDFLDQMFTMKMVMTGDNDGSVYMVVDVPKIRNFDEIKAYLLGMTENPAVTFYLSNMTAGKRHYLCVDGDDTFGFSLNNGSASKWLVNEAKITEDGDILFTTPGLYYINNKQSGMYVKLENSQLADVTAENKDDADIIILDFNDEGAVSTMQQYDGDGDMIATLNMIKSSFKDALEAGGFETNFLDQMFTMKMVMTGDDDGSVYLAVDVPAIENFGDIKGYLLGLTDNPAVTFYLSNMTAGKRHYLCVDGDDTFGFTLDNGTASKWLVENAQINPTDDDLFTEPWYYYINNKLTGKYVQLVNATLADVTAETEDDADIIALDFDEDGNVSVMKQYRGDGDMIATLDMIKSSFKDALEEGGYPTDFLDQMFTMRIVKTGDDDASVYLCVDIPLIPNFNGIRDYLIEKAGGNQAVTFYLSHMTPGKRHYLCVDNDDTFGFTLDNGTASKWMVTRLEVIPIIAEYFPDPNFRQFVQDKYDKNDNWWLSRAELDAVTSMNIYASSNADYAKITDFTGIEWFTNLKTFFFAGTSTNKLVVEALDMSNLTNLESFTCRYGSNLTEVNVSGCTNLNYIQLMYQDVITELDLTSNNKMAEIVVESCPQFAELSIPTPLVSLEKITLRSCASFAGKTLDLTGDVNLYSLTLWQLGKENHIVGVCKDMTGLENLVADYNTFEDNVLDLTGCRYLYNVSVIGCELREIILNGCTNLGTKQASQHGGPVNQNSTFTFNSNYLRALDLTGVTGVLDETAPRNYNYNLTNKYPTLLADHIIHNGYNSQIPTKMKADVSLVYIDRDVTPNVYTYLLYLRMDDNMSSEKESTFELGLAEVGPTNFKMSRVNRWVRLEGEKDIELVSGNRVLGKASPTELDPDLIVGDILSLGLYNIADGEGEKEVTGKIAYLYNTKQDEQSASVVNPEGQLDTQAKKQNYYISQTISSDGTEVTGDNLFPFEVEWKATISDNPSQVVTGVEVVQKTKEVAGVKYYNLTGIESDRPFEGVNIVVTRYTDGSVVSDKRIF